MMNKVMLTWIVMTKNCTLNIMRNMKMQMMIKIVDITNDESLDSNENK